MNISTKKRKTVRAFAALVLMVLCSINLYAQDKRISGKVISSDDKMPLPGVSVVAKNSKRGVSTDGNGNYTITVSAGETLVFRSMGFEAQERKVGNENVINVTLNTETNTLNEVVVVGYGVQKKKLTTGANLQVKGDDLQKQNSLNALQALQGQAPGVQITSTSGQPGAGMNVIIRGKGTIGSNSPLYIVDGMQTGDISYINPADIESIDVLKDAASAAIYGSQAANGVVLVTTKTGKKNQKTTVTFDSYLGSQSVASKARLLNAREYATIMNEAAVNSGNVPFFSNDAIDNLGVNTNWIDQMFVDNAGTQNYTLSANGGGDASIFSTSLSYTNQEGVAGGRSLSNYSRYNFRINTEHNLYKNYVKLGQHATYTYILNNGIGVGNQYNNSLRSAFNTSPFVRMYDDAGNFFDNSASTWNNGEANPYASMVYSNQSENNSQRLLGDVYVSVEPIKGLKFKSSFGLDYNASEGRSYTPIYQLSIYTLSTTEKAYQRLGKGRSLMWDNILSYGLKVASNHNIEVLAGSSSFSSKGTDIGATNSNLRFSGFQYAYLENTENGDNVRINGKPWNDDKRMSYFGRLNYNFKETYLLNATFRADGSSRFAEGHRWGYFPSVSTGWVVSNEKFMNRFSNVLNYFKLRASWGQVGNQNIDAFQYLPTIRFENANYIFGNTEGELANGAYPNRLGNVNVKWETSEQTDLGFDAHFLNGKLQTSFDYYTKNTKDWLIAAPIQATAGADAPFINGGDVTNNGVELGLIYRSKINKLNYSFGVNGAFNKNKIGEIPNREGLIHGYSNTLFANSPEFYRAENGKPIGYFWGLKTNGLFQTEEEVKAYKSASGKLIQPDAAPGDVRYLDLNNDGEITALDKTLVGDPNPNYTYGFNLALDYKSFDFSLQANGVAGNQLVQSYRNISDGKSNYTNEILSRWHGPGSSNRIPRVTLDNRNYAQFSDLYVYDGDFLRISNVTVGYDFSKFLKKKYFSSLRLYASAVNLFTFTKYNGMDPEIGFGEQFASGVDLGYYPRPRIFMLGTNIRF
jgi:TonB-dependent starch-binding outer membrane protein SusC